MKIFLFTTSLVVYSIYPMPQNKSLMVRAVQKYPQDFLQKYSLSHQYFDYKHNFFQYPKLNEKKKKTHKPPNIINCIIRVGLHMGTAQMPQGKPSVSSSELCKYAKLRSYFLVNTWLLSVAHRLKVNFPCTTLLS